MKGLRLEIILLETGELRVNGNLEQKVVALGMLNIAEKLIRDYQAGERSGILVANAGNMELPPR